MNTLKTEFDANVYLVIPGFYNGLECDKLIDRAAELARGFDYKGHASIFQTNEQARTSDDYFLASGDNISFFFEKDAFDENRNLRQTLKNSLNKIVHALPELDPDFDALYRSPHIKQREIDRERGD